MGQGIIAVNNYNRETILFNSDAGQDLLENNTIVLSGKITDFDRIKIYFSRKFGGIGNSCEFLTKSLEPSDMSICLSIVLPGANNSYVLITSCLGNINSTDKKTITFSRNCRFDISTNNVTVDTTQGITIFKIIGIND